MGVFREMPRDPIDDNTQFGFVAGIHQGPELVDCTVPDRRRKKTDRLVSPGAVERVLGNRQQLDMGEPHLLDVLCELDGRLTDRIVVKNRPPLLVFDPCTEGDRSGDLALDRTRRHFQRPHALDKDEKTFGNLGAQDETASVDVETPLTD